VGLHLISCNASFEILGAFEFWRFMLAYLKDSTAPRNPFSGVIGYASAKEWLFRDAAEATVNTMLRGRLNETKDRGAG
jgi:hypothetical protein